VANSKEPSGRGPYDPICGRALNVESLSFSIEYKKRRYYFCSETCRTAFEQRTERFRLNELARAGALLSPGRVRWGLA
jgi:YHS domain-containing protein